MSGNQNQYDPSVMFQEWIQKNGKAQAEFMRNFALLVNENNNKNNENFDRLKEITQKTAKTTTALNQNDILDNMTSLQNQAISKMFNVGQMVLPNFTNWGAYKTTIGSNGRISIPEAERDALGLSEGDLVQVIVLPVLKKSKNKEVKQ